MLVNGMNPYRIHTVFLVVSIIQQKNELVKSFLIKNLQYCNYDNSQNAIYNLLLSFLALIVSLIKRDLYCILEDKHWKMYEKSGFKAPPYVFNLYFLVVC